MLYDIHTHHPAPYPQGVVSAVPEADFSPSPGQFYSLGLHPWQSGESSAEAIVELIERYASEPWLAAVGECGVDPLKGAPMYRQMLLFRRQVEIAEKARKPMVIHTVRSPDIIISIRREFGARQNWAIHGFRGKPTVAQMYLRAGIYLSFGERYNPDALLSMPRGYILAETDESSLSIEEIMALHAATLQMSVAEYRALIAANTSRFLGVAEWMSK